MRENRDLQIAGEIARDIRQAGGRAYFVGGKVRDALMGLDTKDVDIEVYGVPPGTLREILARHGEIYEKGASFGVLSLRHTDLDIAMPRTESRTGAKHRDFDVSVDPYLSTYAASRRRDFTVNAMMQDVCTGEILDHWGGRDDLRAGVLRRVDESTFPEDALRVFRAAQFAARFGFSVEPETLALMRRMDVRDVTRERVFEETAKALLKAEKPSVFFFVLRDTGHLDVFFSEVAQTIGVGQNPKYHPEGDVFTHTMLVLDAAAALRARAQWPLAFLLAALCHDLGKINATELQPDGRITAYRHPQTGVPLARRQMERLTSHTRLIQYVTNMVEMHMRPNMLAMDHSKKKKTRAMFYASVCPEDLILLSRADATGKCDEPYDERLAGFLEERLADYRARMAMPMLTGQDLLDAGLRPGPQFSEMLERARELHFSGIEPKNALAQILRSFKNGER